MNECCPMCPALAWCDEQADMLKRSIDASHYISADDTAEDLRVAALRIQAAHDADLGMISLAQLQEIDHSTRFTIPAAWFREVRQERIASFTAERVVFLQHRGAIEAAYGGIRKFMAHFRQGNGRLVCGSADPYAQVALQAQQLPEA